jgi:peptidoglycan/LPS O-acetylase OafA/YrhL
MGALNGSTFALGYRPSLDGLRGLSILGVLLYHFRVPFFSYGYAGVDVFFVLSGFLITLLLWEEREETGRIDFGAFYLRRARRLFPALAVVLLVVATYAYLIRPAGTGIPLGREILGAALYAMNWLLALHVIPSGGPLSHTWSLSIEEQFYLIWPLLLAVGARFRRALPVLIGLAAAASAVVRNLQWSLGQDWNRVYFGLDSRAEAILLGCLAGLLAARGVAARTGGIGVLGMALGLAVSLDETRYLRAGLSIVSASTALLLLELVAPGPSLVRRALEARPLVALGRISYGLYLWHVLVLHALLKFPVPRWGAALGIAASLAVAALSYVAVERPFLRLNRRDRRP